jgi:hypothetical protein
VVSIFDARLIQPPPTGREESTFTSLPNFAESADVILSKTGSISLNQKYQIREISDLLSW